MPLSGTRAHFRGCNVLLGFNLRPHWTSSKLGTETRGETSKKRARRLDHLAKVSTPIFGGQASNKLAYGDVIIRVRSVRSFYGGSLLRAKIE